MKIDLNNTNQFTKENVRQLVASGNEGKYSRFRVSEIGILYLSRNVEAENVGSVAFQMER